MEDCSTFTQHTLLTGYPGTFRMLATGPGSSVVGTVDAPLQLSQGEADERSGPGSTHPGHNGIHFNSFDHVQPAVQDDEVVADLTVSNSEPPVDLRGCFSEQPAAFEPSISNQLFNITASPAGPGAGFQLPALASLNQTSNSIARQRSSSPAQLCMLWIPDVQQVAAAECTTSVDGRCTQSIDGDSSHFASAADLAIAVPDILRCQEGLALVGSSSAPPFVQLFGVSATKGLVLLKSLMLSCPNWQVSPTQIRIKGVHMDQLVEGRLESQAFSATNQAASSSSSSNQPPKQAGHAHVLLANPDAAHAWSFTSLGRSGGQRHQSGSLAVAVYALPEEIIHSVESICDTRQTVLGPAGTVSNDMHQQPSSNAGQQATARTQAAETAMMQTSTPRVGPAQQQQQQAPQGGSTEIVDMLAQMLQGMKRHIDERLDGFAQRLTALEQREAPT